MEEEPKNLKISTLSTNRDVIMKLVKRRKESTYKLNKNGEDMLMNREEEKEVNKKFKAKYM